MNWKLEYINNQDKIKQKYESGIVLNIVDEKQDDNKQIYIMKFSNNDVKIGVTNNISRRKRELIHQHGYKITECYVTDGTDRAIPIERKMHKLYAKYRLNGEYFRCDYDAAVIMIKKIIEVN